MSPQLPAHPAERPPPMAVAPALPPLPVDAGALRRLEVAQALYGAWTGRGAGQAALAPLWFDGTLDVIDAFVAGDFSEGGDEAPKPLAAIERLPAQPDFATFNDRFMTPNVPVVFPASPWPWPSAPGWVGTDGRPDLFALARSFPPGTAAPVVALACARSTTTLEAYAEWRRAMPADLPAAERRYLKDFQAVAAGGPFHVPPPLVDDWLNAAFDLKERSADGGASVVGEWHADCGISDHRFVYTGPAGTTTPLHCDVMQTFSWSANLCGRKRWAFFPPEQTHLLFDRFGRGLAPTVDPGNRNDLLHPRLAKAAPVWLEQGPGEVVFVPSGWHHEVWNLDDALSVNCNWFNGTNLAWVWSHVRKAAQEAQDCSRALSEAEGGEPSSFGAGQAPPFVGGDSQGDEAPLAHDSIERPRGEAGAADDEGAECTGRAANPKRETDALSFFEVLRATALRTMCVLGGGAAAEEAGSAYGLLPGDLRHQRLTLERIAVVLREMIADQALSAVVERVADNATGGVPGLATLIETCLASSSSWGQEARRGVT